MTFRLGLTGSIGMGKSTTAQMFADEGLPVWDADATVHRLYGTGQPAARAVAQLFPQAIDPDGSVNRTNLRSLLTQDATRLDQLNSAVHPLLAQDRAAFLACHADAPIVLFDIPLLYETGAEAGCDAVVVVSAPPEVQRMRVLDRGMGEKDLALIRSRQLPDAEKRARADYIIPTMALDTARAAVKDIVADIRSRIATDNA